MKVIIVTFLVYWLQLALAPLQLKAAEVWKGELPSFTRDAQSWVGLTKSLRKNEMSYGALAAASRAFMFFSDIETKEFAYQTIVEIIDLGNSAFYSHGYSADARLFASGDIDGYGDSDFKNTYNLMKYILNSEKGLDRWAKQYYDKISDKNFDKYLFYLAVQAYARGELDHSIELLRKILGSDSGNGTGVMVTKTARTLARIYFEKKQYKKSLDIYTEFLLKLPSIQPTDWLEAAWNNYYLKRYPESLGMLYNIESYPNPKVSLNLPSKIVIEKFVLRALIYRDNCSQKSARELIHSFDDTFGSTLLALKQGDFSKAHSTLAQIDVGVRSPFRQWSDQIDTLQREASWIDRKLPKSIRTIAHYLYDSEERMLVTQLNQVSEAYYENAADQLITLSESLKFLSFDVTREKFNPDRVFRETSKAESSSHSLDGFQVAWPQKGDFWRNERLGFKGAIAQECSASENLGTQEGQQ